MNNDNETTPTITETLRVVCSNTLATAKFVPQEIAYQNRAGSNTWLRTIKRTERSFDAFVAKCAERGVEMVCRSAEVSR